MVSEEYVDTSTQTCKEGTERRIMTSPASQSGDTTREYVLGHMYRRRRNDG